MSNFNLPNIPIAGGPTIEFAFHGDVCTAELAGARLRAERLDDEHADLRLHDATGKVLASVVVSKLWDDESITVSVMNVGSALLWSHARWVAAQAGGAATVTIARPARFEKAITFCGQPARVACDGRCHKAWGLSARPRIRLSATNPDDYAWLADDELNEAPVESGTSEGGQHKPRDARGAEDMNKWCVRECERCVMTEAAVPVAVAPPPERAADVRAQLAAIDRASQQLLVEAAHDQADAVPAGGEMPALEAVGREPLPIAVVPHPASADAARVAALEAELAKARRAVAFFTTPVEDGFDWEGWLEGRIEGPPPEVGRHERIVELETALRGLVARVDRAGGYASPEEQDVLRRARRALAGAGAGCGVYKGHRRLSPTRRKR